jgi:hypothetical protein
MGSVPSLGVGSFLLLLFRITKSEEEFEIPLDKEFEAFVTFIWSVLSKLFEFDDFASLGVPYKNEKSLYNDDRDKHSDVLLLS